MLRILISILLLVTIGFSGCADPPPEPVEADGGVKNYNSGDDAPKTVESTEIVSFECSFSLIAKVLEEESELAGRVYTLRAVAENRAVTCMADWYDRSGGSEKTEFTADASFMAALQEIVERYDFARYNGYVSRVSGLPDMYGAKLDIEYASGESIYAYDNQSTFLPLEAIKELAGLFSSQQ